MFQVSPKEEKPLVVSVKPWKVSTGHPPRIGRAGPHADKRKRRQNTRNAQLRNVLKDQ